MENVIAVKHIIHLELKEVVEFLEHDERRALHGRVAVFRAALQKSHERLERRRAEALVRVVALAALRDGQQLLDKRVEELAERRRGQLGHVLAGTLHTARNVRHCKLVGRVREARERLCSQHECSYKV